MRLENYIEHADDMAQDLVNTWAELSKAGHRADLTPDFAAVFERANLYLTAKREANRYREADTLTEQVAAKESAAREAFARACKDFLEKDQATRPGK